MQYIASHIDSGTPFGKDTTLYPQYQQIALNALEINRITSGIESPCLAGPPPNPSNGRGPIADPEGVGVDLFNAFASYDQDTRHRAAGQISPQ